MPPRGSALRDVDLPASQRPLAQAGDGLDGIVQDLNQLVRTETVNLHIAIGRLVIDRLYQGDFSRWRRKGSKETSLRKLASRSGKELMVSATTLYRAVAMYELVERLGISGWKHLSVSHLRGVLAVPQAEQKRLLTVAESEKWTVEHLERETARLRHRSGAQRGRPRLPPFVKTIHRLAGAVESPNDLAGLERLAEMEGKEVQVLLEAALTVRKQLDFLVARLTARRRATTQGT
jgi:hypothetical protein